MQEDACNRRNDRSKRRREDDEFASDVEEDFYGFPAESFIYSENLHDQEEINEVPAEATSRRISKRKVKRRRKEDFIYY